MAACAPALVQATSRSPAPRHDSGILKPAPERSSSGPATRASHLTHPLVRARFTLTAKCSRRVRPIATTLSAKSMAAVPPCASKPAQATSASTSFRAPPLNRFLIQGWKPQTHSARFERGPSPSYFLRRGSKQDFWDASPVLFPSPDLPLAEALGRAALNRLRDSRPQSENRVCSFPPGPL